MFVKNMAQAEIAKEEGVSKVTLTYRVQGIYFGRSAFEEISSRYAYDDTINYYSVQNAYLYASGKMKKKNSVRVDTVVATRENMYSEKVDRLLFPFA